jgi:hypothetical protein
MFAESQANEHVLTTPHASLKGKLEQQLKALSKDPYSNDISVILKWKTSA